MKYLRWCEIVRYRNRLSKMDSEKLPVKLYKLEKSLRIPGWVQNLEFILHYANMDDSIELGNRCDLDVLQARLLHINRDEWWLDAGGKIKLRTFVKVYHKNELKCLVKLNLSRQHRSYVAKMLCGVFPLMLELGRFKNVDEDKRVCLLCTKNVTETEEHFLTVCPGLGTIRKKYMPKFNHLNKYGKCKFEDMFQVDNLKVLACMIEEMQEERLKKITH